MTHVMPTKPAIHALKIVVHVRVFVEMGSAVQMKAAPLVREIVDHAQEFVAMLFATMEKRAQPAR